MAKGRMLNKKISLNRAVNSLSDDTSRLAFTWTIAHLDKEGRVHGDPLVLKSIIFPRRTDITTEMIKGYITEWAEKKLVVWYEVNGELWIQFPKFKENQPGLRGDREADTSYPGPQEGRIVGPAPDLPFEQKPERVITTDDVVDDGVTDDNVKNDGGVSEEEIPELLRSIDGVTPDKLRTYSGPTPEDFRSNSGLTPAEHKVTEFKLREFKTPPSEVAASPPLKNRQKSKEQQKPSGSKTERPPPAEKKLTAFGLLKKINEWISQTDGLYDPVPKPKDGSKEWQFLKRMAARIRSPDLVLEILDRLHHRGKLGKGGIITGWMPEEIGECLEEIRKEAAWD